MPNLIDWQIKSDSSQGLSFVLIQSYAYVLVYASQVHLGFLGSNSKPIKVIAKG
jgi:hypothetical protein